MNEASYLIVQTTVASEAQAQHMAQRSEEHTSELQSH